MKSRFGKIDASARVDVSTIKVKLRLELESAGEVGRTRTELMQALRVSRDALTTVLADMQTAFEIISHVTRKCAFALGRPVTRYWLTEYAPTDLTVAPTPAISLSTDSEALVSGGATCRQCGVAIPRSGPGRSPYFCSPACERLARAGGVTVADLLARVANPLVFARCARRLVEIDLLCRGFEVTPAIDQGGFLLVYDAAGSAALLHVVPISDAGAPPSLDEYCHAALVYRDGRIVYSGKTPLVQLDTEDMH